MEGTRVLNQHHDWDCGVTAIAMLLGVAYGDVAQVVKDNIKDPLLKRRGLILRQLEQVLKVFGFNTRRVYRREGYLDEASGILGLNGGLCGPHGHWVVLKAGMILDPSGGEAWEIDDYFKTAACRPATLLTIR